MFKSLIHTALTVCATLYPVTSAEARNSDHALARWVEKVNQQMDQFAIEARGGETGTAQVSFRRGENGRPTEVAIRGGNASIAAAAVATLRQVRKLPPMPQGFSADQRIVLNFLIGESNDAAYRQNRSRMLASARLANTRLAAINSGTQLATLESR